MPSAILHGNVSSKLEAVQVMTDRMKTVLEEAQTNMSHVQRCACDQANKSRRDEVFAVGDEVVLSTRHINVDLHLPSKLRRRWVGPFTIIAVISLVAFRLDPEVGRPGPGPEKDRDRDRTESSPHFCDLETTAWLEPGLGPG